MTNPLSTPFRAIFSPKSPTMTPGNGKSVAVFLTGTTKACRPWFVASGVIKFA
jgi:hypothetical protein